MSNPFDTKQFKKLKRVWDEKLLDSGFEDIENGDGTLKAPADPRTIKYALKQKESRETYFSIALSFLNSYRFETIEERQIWEAHCSGDGYRAIAKQLRCTPYKVESTVIRLKHLAGLK